MHHYKMKFMFLNVDHFLDHYFTLIFATAAALRLTTEWGLTYSELIPYATPGFVAFGVCAIPAGWIADKWSREGMMSILFIGIGICSVLTSMAHTPFQIAVSLTAIGIFAAIYHPVGLALVVEGREKTGMALAINGVFGNMGVACATLLTGLLIDIAGWRSAFIVSGMVSIAVGLLFHMFVYLRAESKTVSSETKNATLKTKASQIPRNTLLRVFAIILFTTAIGGLIFQSTTFALPKVFEERLSDFANTPTLVAR